MNYHDIVFPTAATTIIFFCYCNSFRVPTGLIESIIIKPIFAQILSNQSTEIRIIISIDVVLIIFGAVILLKHIAQFTTCRETYAAFTGRRLHRFNFLDTSNLPNALECPIVLFFDLIAFFAHLFPTTIVIFNIFAQRCCLCTATRSLTTIDCLIFRNGHELTVLLEFLLLLCPDLLIISFPVLIPGIHRHQLTKDIPIQFVLHQKLHGTETNGIIQNLGNSNCTIGYLSKFRCQILSSIAKQVFEDLIGMLDIFRFAFNTSRLIRYQEKYFYIYPIDFAFGYFYGVFTHLISSKLMSLLML